MSASTTDSVVHLPALLVQDEHGSYRPSSPPAGLERESALSDHGYALSRYGRQTTSTAPLLPHALAGVRAPPLVRLVQTNRWVTSGVNADGSPSGFQATRSPEHVAAVAAADAVEVMPATELAAVIECSRDGTHDILVSTEAVADRQRIATTVRAAAVQCVHVRASQAFLDGNHRTALVTFILRLAAGALKLGPTFCVYRAYLIISARHHGGHRDNWLDADAERDAADALFRYARARVRPCTPTWADVEPWACEVRALPVAGGLVEAAATSVRGVVTATARREAFHSLGADMQRRLLLAHPRLLG